METENEKRELTPEQEEALTGLSCPVTYTGDEKICDDTNIDEANHIILAHEERSKKRWERFKYHFHKVFSIRDDVANHEEIKERIMSGGKSTGTNMVIMICAILIACVGLYTNSIAVIIGAMLISPLMNRILIMSFGTASADNKLTWYGLRGFLMQIGVSLMVATLFFLILPPAVEMGQIEARTTPTIFDVIIAVAGGVAGIIGQTRKGQYNNVIPGVAIATALMPPLCCVGYFLSKGSWMEMGLAAELFIINFYFIYMSSVVVLNILEIPKVKELTVRQWRIVRFCMVRNTIIVLIPVIVITILFAFGIIPIHSGADSGAVVEIARVFLMK